MAKCIECRNYQVQKLQPSVYRRLCVHHDEPNKCNQFSRQAVSDDDKMPCGDQVLSNNLRHQ